MKTLFVEGGFPMFFVLGFGFIALAWAGWYAARGKKASLRFVFAMMTATLFATGSGICADLGATFKAAAGLDDGTSRPALVSGRDLERRIQIALEGSGESMAPGIMGFSLLALTSLLLAVGSARVARDEE